MFKFKKMRIKKRLTTGFVLVSVITAVAAVIGGIAMVVVANQYARALKNYGFAQGDIGKALVAFADTRSATRAAIGYDDQAAVEEAIATHDEKKEVFKEYMETIGGELVSAEEREPYENVEAILEQYWNIDTTAISLGKSDDMEQGKEAQKMAAEQLDPMFDEIYGNLAALMEIKVDEGNALSSSLRILSIILILVIIVIIAAAMAISTKLGVNIAKGIAVPLVHAAINAPGPSVAADAKLANIPTLKS